MNLTDITTPADLVKANEEAKTPLQVAMEAMTEVNMAETIQMCRWLVGNLKDFHAQITDELSDECAPNVAIWAADTEKLTMALALLNNVEAE